MSTEGEALKHWEAKCLCAHKERIRNVFQMYFSFARVSPAAFHAHFISRRGSTSTASYEACHFEAEVTDIWRNKALIISQASLFEISMS